MATRPGTEIGRYIKRLRLAAGITQLELALSVGEVQARISQFEIGKRVPDREMCERLAQALKGNSDEMLLSAGFAPSQEATLAGIHSGRLGSQLDELLLVNKEIRDLLKQQVQLLREQRSMGETREHSRRGVA